MVNIAICDDRKEFLDEAARLTSDVFKSINLPCSIRKYLRPDALLLDVSNVKYDLIILDIVMPEINGLELATKLRAEKIKSEIIFITSNPEYALESFSVFPLTFITKPIDQDKFKAAINLFIEKSSFSPAIIVKNEFGEKISISIDSILYLESNGHEVIYALDDGTSLSSSLVNFTKATEVLPSSFYRCHRCFTVNLKKVHSIIRCAFILEDGTQIPIAKNEFMEAKRQFTLY